jgi:secondary thiamine-phosphate synthase enzyme
MYLAQRTPAYAYLRQFGSAALTPYARPCQRPRPRPFASLQSIHLTTTQPLQLLDITEHVAALVGAHSAWDGVVTVCSQHTTAGVRLQENEPLLMEDLRQFLERLAPAEATYAHNDFEHRTEHMHPDERPNGHSHCLHLLLGGSAAVPVTQGRLQLGTWQRVFLVELDGPRPDREVLVQMVGVSRGGGAR